MTKACTRVVVANSNRTMVTVHSAMKPRCTSCVSSEKLPRRRRHRFRFSVSTAVIVTNGTRGNANGYNSGLTPKIAFLFPGQGSQFAGMGKALADTWPAARRIFEEADDALGFPISRLSFEGPEDQLKLTENTQPALLTVSMAAFAVLQEQGLRARLRRRPQPGRVFGAGGGGKSAVRRRRPAGPPARPVYAGSRAARRGRHGGAAQAAGRKTGRGAGAGRPGRGGERREPEFAGPDGDRGPCGSGGPRHGIWPRPRARAAPCCCPSARPSTARS